jgi:2-polyprenyl-6-methoxyphenol hydroxylase-like FAD-dependent oxidoreductase
VARDKSTERIAARFVVAADGRGSGVRKWAGFTTQKNVQPFHFAGVLLTEVSGRNDIVTFLFNPDLGLVIASVRRAILKKRFVLAGEDDGTDSTAQRY